MTPYERLQWEAERLGEGSHRIGCPWCLGGSSGEKSLSLAVSVAGNIQFRCFRANCGKSGGKREAVRTTKAPRYFTADTETLTDERQLWFTEKFGFVPASTRYAPLMDRYVYTVWGPDGRSSRGYVARSFDGTEPKVLTYNERPAEPFLGWSVAPWYVDEGPVVLVEDWVSSEKVADAGGIGVCLNGTYLSAEAAMELAEQARDRRLVIALDRDAFAKGVQISSKYGGLFKHRPRVWRLDKDLKYVDGAVIQRAMNDDNCNDFGDDWARATDRQGVH